MSTHGEMPPVTGVILAGGRGSRMGGQDKGLVEYRGQPLIEHVIGKFSKQVDELLINANRNLESYACYGYPVIEDSLDDYQGPLAGILAALEHATNAHVIFVPCDMPDIPGDLVQRLVGVMQSTDVMGAYAHDGEFPHPVCMALRPDARILLDRWLSGGNRRARDWLIEIDAVRVDFSDCADAFVNINSLPQQQL